MGALTHPEQFLAAPPEGRHAAMQAAWRVYHNARVDMGELELLHAAALLRERFPEAVQAELYTVFTDDGDAVRVAEVTDARGNVLFDEDEGDGDLGDMEIEDHLTGAYEKDALNFSGDHTLDLLNPT